MSIWAGRPSQAALVAASSRAGIPHRNVDVDSVQIIVIAELERLISTVNTLKSDKPELNRASELLLACKAQINQAVQPIIKKDELKSATPSMRM